MSVVVGYMPSPQCEAALAIAVEEAASRGTSLVVAAHRYPDPDRGAVHATESELPPLPDGALYVGPDGEEESADQILRAAVQHDAELVVLGLRHRSRIGKLNLGASAQRVFLESTCPVLVVKDISARR